MLSGKKVSAWEKDFFPNGGIAFAGPAQPPHFFAENHHFLVDSQTGISFALWPADMKTSCGNSVVAPEGAPTVLVVSADGPVREALTDALRSEKHRALQACNARHAMEMLAGQPIRLAVVDINGGSRQDWGVVDELTRAYPGLRVILLTAAEPAAHPLVGRTHACFQKPLLDLRALLAKVTELNAPAEWAVASGDRANCLKTERTETGDANFR